MTRGHRAHRSLKLQFTYTITRSTYYCLLTGVWKRGGGLRSLIEASDAGAPPTPPGDRRCPSNPTAPLAQCTQLAGGGGGNVGSGSTDGGVGAWEYRVRRRSSFSGATVAAERRAAALSGGSVESIQSSTMAHDIRVAHAQAALANANGGVAAVGGPAYCFDTRPVGEYQLPSRYQVGAGITPPVAVQHMRRSAGEMAYQEAAEHRDRLLASGSPVASSPSVRGVGSASSSTRRPKVRDQRPKAVQVQAGEQGGEAQGGEQGGADRRPRGPTNRWRNHGAPRTPSASAAAHRAVPPYLGAPAPAVYSIYTL